MKNLSRICLLTFLLPFALRADEVHARAIAQVIDTYAALDTTFRAVATGQTPIKEFATQLTAANDQFIAIAKSGVSEDVGNRLRGCAEVLASAVQAVDKVTGSDSQKLVRCQDDLGDLMRLTGKVCDVLGTLSRLSIAEREKLGEKVEILFGKKVIEFPRGDTSPFASGSRSPFASSTWLLNLQFDVSVFSGAKSG